jgi:hypothetical protein
MKIKYFGTANEKGLTLTASLFTSEGDVVHQGFSLVETGVNTAIYKTDNIFDTIEPISAGIYVARIEDSSGVFRGFQEIIFNGVREITLLELKFLTEKELMQLRDALGLDGDKRVAKGGQLQKKSEAPYNNTIDTNEWRG